MNQRKGIHWNMCCFNIEGLVRYVLMSGYSLSYPSTSRIALWLEHNDVERSYCFEDNMGLHKKKRYCVYCWLLLSYI